MTALQQKLYAADCKGLVDLPEHFVEPEDVPFRRSNGPIERAEVAPGDADVRVVDIAIDDVGGDAVGMLARANAVGEAAEKRGGGVPIQLERFGGIDTLARSHFDGDLVNRHTSESPRRRSPAPVPRRIGRTREGPDLPPSQNRT